MTNSSDLENARQNGIYNPTMSESEFRTDSERRVFVDSRNATQSAESGVVDAYTTTLGGIGGSGSSPSSTTVRCDHLPTVHYGTPVQKPVSLEPVSQQSTRKVPPPVYGQWQPVLENYVPKVEKAPPLGSEVAPIVGFICGHPLNIVVSEVFRQMHIHSSLVGVVCIMGAGGLIAAAVATRVNKRRAIADGLGDRYDAFGDALFCFGGGALATFGGGLAGHIFDLPGAFIPLMVTKHSPFANAGRAITEPVDKLAQSARARLSSKVQKLNKCVQKYKL